MSVPPASAEVASSGDLLADRRYAWAEAAFDDGDLATAIDLLTGIVAIAPGFVAGWFLLGRALEADARPDEAGRAFRAALDGDPDDVLGAGIRLAQLGAAEAATAMSPGYVTRLFDDYALRFDRHLVRSLKYRAPALLHGAVRRAASRLPRAFRFDAALDLGCGTGLAGEAFRGECRRFAGIDLSPGMVRRAEAKNLYDELAVGDLVAWLGTRAAASADLALAADVFVYVADLAPAFAGVARVLRPNGFFAFTIQAHDGEGISLGADGRYAHGDSHLRDLAARAGLAILLLEPASTREDRGRPVPGRLAVLAPDQARSVWAKSSPL